MKPNPNACPLCTTQSVHRPRFFVRRVGAGWVLDREETSLRPFETKKAALALARTIVASHPGAELVVES